MRDAVQKIAGLDQVVVLPTPERASRICAQHVLIPLLSKRQGADVVVYSANYVPALPLQPSVAIVQNMFLAHPTRTRGRARAIYRSAMRSLIIKRAQAIVAISNLMAQELEQAAPRLRGRIHVIRPGLDIAFFRSGAIAGKNAAVAKSLARPYFLSVGTVWPHRNFDLAIQGLARSELAHHLLIAGATPRRETDRLQEIARGLSVDDRLHFLGVVRPDNMPQLYAGATALIGTSFLEAFPLSVIEAMAAGTPVIAVRRTSYPEAIGDAGILSEPTADDLALAMVSALQPDLRRELIQRGSARANLFDFSRFTDELLDVCRKYASP
jgi:glycosyltransferase involved in cell wall biosynthesis